MKKKKQRVEQLPLTVRPKVDEPNPDYGKSQKGDPAVLLDPLPEKTNPVRGETASDPGSIKRRA